MREREGRIFARRKRGILWIAWHRESTKSTDRRVAERKLRDKLTSKGEAYVPGSQRVTVGELAEMLREHLVGRPIRDIDDAWRSACKRAELVDRRFHDLRRYAAMRLVRAGVARSEAMVLLGHETDSMFTRYALNDVPALERAVEKLAALDAKR